MPRRDDLKTILIIGSGPIVIGQGCEFDYSGTQACKALREEGYRIVLVNSNPATIMTDPEFADQTYIEPVTPKAVEKIIAAQSKGPHRIDALLPTLGGQTGLNTAVALADAGVLDKYGVEMIGATRKVIHRAEDRTEFKNICVSIGLDVPRSGVAHSMEQAREIAQDIGLPLCIRPAYTLGGTGGGFAYNVDEFETIAARGLEYSPVSEILIEESVLGWKEYELEVMRDKADNVVIVCSIENFDAMGVHTGDSITVAPAQTLTDKEYQLMRDAAIAIIRAIGVETGGSNIQFAIDPVTGRMIVVEMNPRVSRSSALASKATGFPIAKIAAKLAVGYTLDEIPNDITRKTPACFEPAIDYCVVKIPRWTFEKFPDADETLTTQMKSVGEAMSIGRTFKEALQKGIRSMEVKRFGLGLDRIDKWLRAQRSKQGLVSSTGAVVEDMQFPVEEGKLHRKLSVPSQGRLYYIRYALKMGWTIERINELTHIDPWFLSHIKQLVDFEDELQAAGGLVRAGEDLLRKAKQWGYSDVQLATIFQCSMADVRSRRQELGIEPVFKLVDTCSAEFEAFTPYYYSTHETPTRKIDGDRVVDAVDDEIRVSPKKKVIILGGGPNRIGQGIEFDYCCVHAAMAARELGFESVMVNSNPETVSTDYDTSDMLFFEPLTLEDVFSICIKLSGRPLKNGKIDPEGLLYGAIVQFGGQTPLHLAEGLEELGVPIIGTSPDSIDLAEDRKRFGDVLEELKLQCPPGGTAFSVESARSVAARIGYPVLVRPSYVLGGRAMEIVSDERQLDVYMAKAVDASTVGRDHPILIDKFLDNATEVDVDCIADFGPRKDGSVDPTAQAIVCGVMEHIEHAGIHSGDSACSLPPFGLSNAIVDEIKRQAKLLARRLNVRGLMNIQFAVKEGKVYILEVNPRASRTVPFVSKATGVPWAMLAAKVTCGASLVQLGACETPRPAHTAVKESVFPFTKFPGVDVVLGPEMRSTGEVMGIDATFGMAFAKSQEAAGMNIPSSGTIFMSVCDSDKPYITPVAKSLQALGFTLIGSPGTCDLLTSNGVEIKKLRRLSEGRPNVADMIVNRQVQMLIITPTKRGPATDEGKIRALATRHNLPLVTTVTGARAIVAAIEALRAGDWQVKPLQEYYTTSGAATGSGMK
ncbi:MAG: carbamoyl-phosphate synthase large subunit [Planctomycetes bacterium]|jgi:carbamoyl-phosphate synthase large subunit|nr:carbamoyl-phosphate synthase large subunit [Planctomycetota bacterium]